MEDSMEMILTENDYNTSKFIDDIIGVRDLLENEPIIKKLDQYLISVRFILKIFSSFH